MDSIVVPPSCELPLWRSQDALAELARSIARPDRPEVQEEWARQLDQLAAGECFEGRELFAALLHDAAWPRCSTTAAPATCSSWTSRKGCAWPRANWSAPPKNCTAEFVNTGELPAGLRAPYIRWRRSPPAGPLPRLEIGALDMRKGGRPPTPIPSPNPYRCPPFEPPKLYTGNIGGGHRGCAARMLADGQRVVIVSQQAERLRELFEEADIYPTRRKLPPGPGAGVGRPPRARGAAPRTPAKSRNRKTSQRTSKIQDPNPKSDTEPLLDPPAAGRCT